MDYYCDICDTAIKNESKSKNFKTLLEFSLFPCSTQYSGNMTPNSSGGNLFNSFEFDLILQKQFLFQNFLFQDRMIFSMVEEILQ